MLDTIGHIYRLTSSREKRIAVVLLLMSLVVGVLDTVFMGGAAFVFNLGNNITIYSDDLRQFPVFTNLANREILIFVLSSFSILALVLTLVRVTFIRKSLSVINAFEAILTTAIFDRVLRMPQEWGSSQEPNELAKKILADVNAFIGLSVLPMFQLVTSVITVCAISSVLVFYEPFMSITGLVMLVFIVFPVQLFANSRAVSVGNNRVLAQSERFRTINSSLLASKDIAVHEAHQLVVNQFNSAASTFSEASANAGALSQIPRIVIEFVFVLAGCLVVGIAQLEMAGGISTSSIALMALGLFRILPSINQFNSCWTSIKVGSRNLRDLQVMLEEISVDPNSRDEMSKQVVKDGAAAQRSQSLEIRMQRSKLPLGNSDQYLSVGDLVFRYPDSKNPVIDGFSYEFQKERWYGVVGASGCGKSTLLDLLFGLLTPNDGHVLHGAEVDAKAFSYALQSPMALVGSIRSNIALGRYCKDSKIEEIMDLLGMRWAVDAAGGLDSSIGSLQSQFSGGQIQRLMLGRAIYNEPKILLMDEATSALDKKNELLVVNAIKKYLPYTTCIAVTHSEEFMRCCDELIVMS